MHPANGIRPTVYVKPNRRRYAPRVTEPLDDAALDFAHRMFDLARDGATEELAGQLALGLPANMTNHKGDTLLILAAYHNHPATVAALLAAGADPAAANDRGQTALAAAVFRQNSETITTLLAAGANPHDGNPSAIATAEFFGLSEMSELLKSK
jgi:ankyrin repeat protein